MDTSDRRRRASEEAATWWVRLQSEELAGAEREQFVDWLRESAVHVAEMLRVAKVHDALHQFQSWMRIDTDGADDEGENVISLPPHPSSASSLVSLPSAGSEQYETGSSLSNQQRGARDEAFQGLIRRRLWIGAIAASLAAVAISTMFFSPTLRGQTIETERGERREVALADGSVLEVDPETRLRVKFEEHTRRVVLERGRALFRVAKNQKRPFLVQANGTTVRAVGTAFGVERQKQGIVVTVAEGKVEVFASTPSPRQEVKETSTEGGASGAGQGAELKAGRNDTVAPAHMREEGGRSGSESSRELFLTAGQQVTVQSSGTAEPVRKVDSDRELAWARGRLVFDNETVAMAVAEFNRYNRVQLHVADEALARRTVSAVFDAADPESFIAFIQTVATVRVIRSDPADITIAVTTIRQPRLPTQGEPVMK